MKPNMQQTPRVRSLTAIAIATAVTMLSACYSNNCPLDNNVLCNFSFHDSYGTPVQYNDTITVTTLMPGHKTIYTYRKMGNKTVVKDVPAPELVEQGYTETVAQQRNDTILLNNLCAATSMSLPMSYYRNRDTLIVSYRSISAKDTIWIDHDSYPYVELPECGTYRYHTLLGIKSTAAAIDHIEITTPHVDYEGNTNIKIYFNGAAETPDE